MNGHRQQQSARPGRAKSTKSLRDSPLGTIVILRNDKLIAQLVGLERTGGRVGKDTIGHPPNGQDDIANAVAGAAATVANPVSTALSAG